MSIHRLILLASLFPLASCTATLGASDARLAGDVGGTNDASTGDAGDAGPGGTDDAGTDDAASQGDGPSLEDASAALPQSCANKSAEITASAGNTVLVSPGSFGQVTVGGNPTTLRQVINNASPGDTILLANGTYTFEEASPGSYTGLYFTTPDITLRGQSGDPSAVVLDSNYADHGGQTAAITVAAAGTVLADLTVQRSIFHLIHFLSDGDSSLVHRVHLVDGGQQLLKASGTNIDDVEISCSRLIMTAAGRDNVWGYGATDGGTRCYTGGIDTHDSRDWHVHDCYFEGIYCNAGGVQRPAHGKKAEDRDNQTYTGGLAEHAIHMWDAVQGHGHVIERNRIVNCARGIGLGLAVDVYDTVIRNNMVFSKHAGSGEHDVGIIVERAHDSRVFNNTVFFSSASAYPNAIEYRWSSTSKLEVRNNLANQLIRSRDGAVAATSNNLDSAPASWFVDGASGDLHLSSCGIAQVAGVGTVLGDVTDDIDQQPRSADNDIGADQCQ